MWSTGSMNRKATRKSTTLNRTGTSGLATLRKYQIESQLQKRQLKIMKVLYSLFILPLDIKIKHLYLNLDSNAVTFQWPPKLPIMSITFSCKMISIPMGTRNGSSSRFRILSNLIRSNSKYLISTKSTIYTKWV